MISGDVAPFAIAGVFHRYPFQDTHVAVAHAVLLADVDDPVDDPVVGLVFAGTAGLYEPVLVPVIPVETGVAARAASALISLLMSGIARRRADAISTVIDCPLGRIAPI